MASLTVKIDDAGLEGRLDSASSRATGNMGNPWPAIGMLLVNGIKRNFREPHGWYPGGWTLSRRAASEGGQTLVDSALLRNSMHASTGNLSASAGSDVRYAAIHQYGGVIRPKTAKALLIPIGNGVYKMVKKVTIPARPYLPIDGDKLEPGIAEKSKRLIVDGIKGDLT